MKFLMAIFLIYVIMPLSIGANEQPSPILTIYKKAIENYIMTGYESRWQHCDLLSSNRYFFEDVPQIIIDLDKLKMLDVKSTFSKSSCLLVYYDENNMVSLSALLDFGRVAINHVRLALVIKIGSGFNLEMARNSSNLPFLVAVESDNGQEQFLCPVVGEVKPHLSPEMCKTSYQSYKGNKLRIGLTGVLPEFTVTRTGTIEGTAVWLIKMLAERLRFTPEIVLAPSFSAAANQVCLLS